jgi:GT2 family glycosyltransferase
MPDVTVVIPTFNRPELVARTLDAIGRLTLTPGGVETIVVDDGSEPAAAAALDEAAAGIPGVRVLRQENRGPAAARNLGYRSGTAPLVAFLDDDCAPAPDWLLKLVEPLNGSSDTGAVGGRVLPAPPTNWVSRFCAATEYSSGLQPVFENAATANACYRREALEALGGFDERFIHPGGDDPDLSERARAAGYRLEFVPDAVVYHAEFEAFGDFLRSMYRRGLGEARLARKHGRTGRVAARAVLAPLYFARTAWLAWLRTVGKGAAHARAGWVVLESIGRAAFIVGSIRGLLNSR